MAIGQESKPQRKSPRVPRDSAPAKALRKNERFAQDLVGISLIACGLVLLISLLVSSKSESGVLGAELARVFRLMFGCGSYVVPVLLVGGGGFLIYGRSPESRAEVVGGSISLWLIFLAAWDYAHPFPSDPFDAPHAIVTSGFLGAAIDFCFCKMVGMAAPVVYLGLALASLVWLTDRRLLSMLQATGRAFIQAGAILVAYFCSLVKWGRSLRSHEASSNTTTRKEKRKGSSRIVVPDDALVRFKGLEEAETKQKNVSEPMRPFVNLPQPVKPIIVVQKPLNLDRLGEVEDFVNKDYQLPPLDLLNLPKPISGDIMADNKERQSILMQTLTDFKIGANVRQVAMGPTVTRYEVQLEPGILVKKIVALADNLAMSLAAIDVRVEAPIPGKSAIGIEVPNEKKQIVTLRECIDTGDFVNASKLTFALGKDVAGSIKFADLTKMPHVLVGGSTNSGKSCCLNALICSILYRCTPREVRFVMIDPKRVELSMYDGIPHLLAPVIKDTKQAAGILRSVLVEMDKRYNLFSEIGTRNVDGYNAKVDEKKKLPYIVVVIDELADLMMSQGAEVETCIARLTALARATGIHLVIATQRPSVDVITGTIKANIPSRIAFAVSTQVDSRTILDSMGADRLIGRGDMLYLSIDAAKPTRIQGCYVTESETAAIVKYLKDQEEPRYTMTPTAATDGFSDEADDGDTDELFEPAVRWLSTQYERGASTSSLQRRFKVGYTRAARLIEAMEARGIVGAQEGVKPREILLHPENVESYFSGRSQGVLFEERMSNSQKEDENAPFDVDD